MAFIWTVKILNFIVYISTTMEVEKAVRMKEMSSCE
jgi:hypothetical protein